MGQIEPEHPELFALDFGKIAESDFVYTLASTNINQSAPNLVKVYVTIRSQMSSIMDLIGPELSELFVLEFVKIAEPDFVYTLVFTKCRPVSTKHDHNICDNKFLDRVRLSVKSYSNMWSYLPLNKETLFNLTFLHFIIYKD